jgi:proteasome assembly chaperone 3
MQVPLEGANPSRGENFLPPSNDDMLPLPQLTARTLLGGATPERETTGQLYAVQLASAIATKNPDETRTVMVGMGLTNPEPSREQFFDLMELAVQCL